MRNAWADGPAKRQQKNTAVRWARKHGKNRYGYKNHVNVDRQHKLIRRYWGGADAVVHDSRVVDDLPTSDNAASGVLAHSGLPVERHGSEGESQGLDDLDSSTGLGEGGRPRCTVP